jgi:alpha/beta superfamily hydrolase
MIRADESQARRAKWRREFKSLGRERVRHLVQVGGISGNQQRCEAAVDWLRDQHKGAESRERWTLALVIFGAVVALMSLLLMLG